MLNPARPLRNKAKQSDHLWVEADTRHEVLQQRRHRRQLPVSGRLLFVLVKRCILQTNGQQQANRHSTEAHKHIETAQRIINSAAGAGMQTADGSGRQKSQTQKDVVVVLQTETDCNEVKVFFCTQGGATALLKQGERNPNRQG